MKGIYAALITPVDDRGHPHLEQFIELLDFVVAAGVDGVCIGGGTSEYPIFSLGDRRAIITTTAHHLRGRVPFVTAIGAANKRDVLELGQFAMEEGSRQLLLPMPYFFRYGQQDLEAYARAVVRELDFPCLLYNLPVFTNPLDPATAQALIQTEKNVIGLKDSSGDRTALTALASGRGEREYALLCGSDGLFFDSLDAGWDGAISGVASCAPELLTALYRHYRVGNVEEARRCQGLLDELITLIDRLPFPWSIRIACAVRGLRNGPLPWPIAPDRAAEIERQRESYAKWFDAHAEGLRADVRQLTQS